MGGGGFNYYLMLYLCMCLFVIRKALVTFDPNNAKFTQKIDDCEGWVINLFDQKRCRIGWKKLENVLGHYEKLHFVYR